MSEIFTALKEALGEDFMTSAQEDGVVKRASQLRQADKNMTEDDSIVEALKEAYGTGVMNVNLTNQFKVRAQGLRDNPKGRPLASGGVVKKQSSKLDLGPTHNSGPLTGSDAGKDEKALSITDGLGDHVMADQKEAFESGRTKGAGGGPAVDNGNTVGGQNPSTFGTSGGPSMPASNLSNPSR